MAEENDAEETHHDARHDHHNEVHFLKVPDIVFDLFVEADAARDKRQAVVYIGEQVDVKRLIVDPMADT